VPEGQFGLRLEADGFRPYRIIMGGGDALKAIMAPIMSGTIIDADGSAVKDVWVRSEDEVRFRADGLLYDPRNNSSTVAESNWTDDTGSFSLTSELTLRSWTQTVLVTAVDDAMEQMAFLHVPVGELSQPKTLRLQRVRDVHGVYVVQGANPQGRLVVDVLNAEGQLIASLEPITRFEERGLRVEYRLRLPPGHYHLVHRNRGEFSELRTPLVVPEGDSTLEVAEVVIPSSSVDALKGQPAPALAGRWRDNREVTLESLRGKVVVLDFWGCWSSSSLWGTQVLLKIAEPFKDRPVEWVAIHDAGSMTFEELDANIAWFTKSLWMGRSLPFHVMIDASPETDDDRGVTAKRYGVRDLPTLVVIDQEGNVVGPATNETLPGMLESLLK
jgi:thiol-disulfide isomerase/thioredoxin